MPSPDPLPPRPYDSPPRSATALARRALLLLALASCASPPVPPPPGVQGVAFTGFVGRYADNSLPNEIALLKPVDWEDAYMTGVAASQVFYRPSEACHWEIEAQIVKHWEEQDHWEINGLFTLRWKRFPWDRFLRTTLAVGEGLSWASEVPALEEATHDEGESAQLLNYLLFELTWAAPSWKHWSVSTRIHHRSGIFGLFDGVHGGSNVFTVGLRYEF